MKVFLKKLSVPLFVALFSVIATLLVQQYLLARARPNLRQAIIKTDLSGLTDELKKQIGLVPITYTLQNLSQSSAQNVSIFVSSDLPLQIADLKFTQDSEDHQITTPDPHEVKINAPSIRPNGILSFQILTIANNGIKFNALSDNANLLTSNGEKPGEGGKTRTVLTAVGIAVLVWLPVLCALIYLFWQIGKVWRNLETDPTPPEIKKQLILLLTCLYIYDDLIIGSTSVLQPWLPLPRIRFEELISVFLLYLLITRYKMIEQLILAIIERYKNDKRN